MQMFFNPDKSRTQVWSCGGGVQSTAIAVLICQGRLPKPDVAVMVDTGRENSGTWAYLDRYTRPALREAGVTLETIKATDWGADIAVFESGQPIIPAFTTQSGEPSKLSTYCSGSWKRDTQARYFRSLGVKQADQWIGFSLEEQRRLRPDRRQWLRMQYPLIELRMNRASCISLVESAGWPPPPRSSCWMCPNKSDREWIDLRDNWPADFAEACRLDERIREQDPHAWLHKQCIPLAQVKLEDRDALFTGCASGMCFV